MNRLELQKLTMKNFQGAPDRVFAPGGEDASVTGANATGKTTIFNAFTWLLFGKDSLGRAAFDVKTLARTGEPLHNLEHEAEGTLRLGARTITLRRTYVEQYTRKRGQAEATFSGHTTNYAVNGVPVQKGEYEATVAEIVGEDAFRMLTDPMHFAERIHWQERRNTLIDVCGDIDDQEVIDADPALADLPEILGDRTMDQHRKAITARRAAINANLKDIPGRVDEKLRGLPDVGGLDEDSLKALLATLRAKRSEAEQAKARIEAGGEVAEKRKQLAGIEAELQTIANRVTAEHDATVAALRAQRNNITSELDEAERAVTNCDRDIREAAAEIERLDTQMAAKRTEWAEVNAEAFAHDGTDTCAACGQKLPAGKVEAARTKALEAFNAGKARQLTAIDTEGKRLRERYDELMEGCEDRDRALQAAEQTRDELADKRDELDQQLGAMERPAPADDAAYQKAAAGKRGLEAEISALATDNTAVLADAAGKVAAIDEQVSGIEGQLARIDEHRRGQARIKELEAEQRRLSSEFEELERQLFLCDEFEKRRAAMLNARINEHFEHVEFRLFRDMVSGGVEPCCDVSYGGVPWASLNTGAQINAGLDIINTLAERFGVAAPIFVDHAESVTEFVPTRGQRFLLVHDRDVEQLEVTVDERKHTEAAA